MSFAPTSITMADAGQALRDGLAEIDRGNAQIDLSRLHQFDSSAVSAVLAWRRAASARGTLVQITGLPDGLRSLAVLYGVEDHLRS